MYVNVQAYLPILSSCVGNSEVEITLRYWINEPLHIRVHHTQTESICAIILTCLCDVREMTWLCDVREMTCLCDVREMTWLCDVREMTWLCDVREMTCVLRAVASDGVTTHMCVISICQKGRGLTQCTTKHDRTRSLQSSRLAKSDMHSHVHVVAYILQVILWGEPVMRVPVIARQVQIPFYVYTMYICHASYIASFPGSLPLRIFMRVQ